MVNQIVFMASAIGILSVCYIIAIKSQPAALTFYETNPEVIRRYLFSRFSWLHVTISNIGSYISFYSIILAAFIFPFGWGALPFLSVNLGAALGFLFLYRRIKTVVSSWKPGEDFTYLDLVQRRIGEKKAGLALSFFPIALMIIYVVGAVSTEIRSLELFYAVSDTPASNLIAGTEIQPSGFRFNFFILISCIVYVLRGGFRGVIRTDKLQLAVFGLLWAISVVWMFKAGVQPLQLIREQLVWGKDSLLIAFNSVLLVAVSTGCMLDNWIRTAGALIKDCAAENKPRDEWLRHIRKSLAATTAVGLILFTVPGLLGLQARQVSSDLWDSRQARAALCQQAGAPRVPGEGLAESYLAGCFRSSSSPPPLLPRQVEGSWLPPKVETAGNLKDAVQAYTDFTNSPLALSSLFLREFFNRSVRSGSEWVYISVIALIIAAFLCAVLTTIDSYMISICQLLSKYSENWPSRSNGRGAALARKLLAKPGLLVLALAGVIVAYSRIEFLQQPRIYISVGFFAYGGLMFLFFISYLTAHDGSYDDRPVLVAVLILYGLFLAMFVIHLMLIGGQFEGARLPLSRFFRSRAYLVAFPFLALSATALFFAVKRKRAAR